MSKYEAELKEIEARNESRRTTANYITNRMRKRSMHQDVNDIDRLIAIIREMKSELTALKTCQVCERSAMWHLCGLHGR